MLRTRVITAAISLIIVISLLLWGYNPWRITVWLVTLLGTAEFTGLAGFRRFSVVSIWAYCMVSFIQWWPDWHLVFVVQMIVAITLVLPVVLKNRVTLAQSAMVLVGALYLGYGGESLSDLRGLSRGWAWLLLLLIAIWMTDTVAYFVGSRLKGPKLWPSISPGKTVSGAVGGILGGIIGTVIFGYFVFPHFDWFAYILLGALISITGQLGDLVESAYKRSAGVKDSGNLFPGHGGVLDRLDSLVFAAPLAYHLISSGIHTWFH